MRDAWGMEGMGCPGARGARIGAPRRIFPLARSPALGVKFSATRRGTENAFQREARPSHAGFGNGNAREVDAPSRLRVPSRRTRVANRVHSRRARQGGAGSLPVLGLGSRPDAAHQTKAAVLRSSGSVSASRKARRVVPLGTCCSRAPSRRASRARPSSRASPSPRRPASRSRVSDSPPGASRTAPRVSGFRPREGSARRRIAAGCAA